MLTELRNLDLALVREVRYNRPQVTEISRKDETAEVRHRVLREPEVRGTPISEPLDLLPNYWATSMRVSLGAASSTS